MKTVSSDYRGIALILVLPILLFAACHNSSDMSKKDRKYTFEDIREAKAIAICLSGALTAPDSLTNRVLADLAEIRASYIDEFALASPDEDYKSTLFLPIRFTAPWLPSCILVKLESATSQLVVNGEYNAWDELNRHYRLSDISLTMINLNWVELNFKGQFHPRRLSELYMKLPGVLRVDPNFTGGGSAWIYPSWRAGSQLTYVFRHGWGDCPAGCIYNEYWYFFSHESGDTIFVGYWNREKTPKEPDWWSDARLNIEQYRTF